MKNHAHTRTLILGLGSNLGDRLGYLTAAIQHLTARTTHLFHGEVTLSPIYESPALLLTGAPKDWDIPFYNMAIRGESSASPELVLHIIKKAEMWLGRKDRGRWAPREIDIDLLAMGDLTLQRAALTIPHASLLEREFAFLPFADIFPDWHYPIPGAYQGKQLCDFVQDLPRGQAMRTNLQCMEQKALAA